MAESATAYLPFPFPGPDFLDFVIPDGVELSEVDDAFVLAWAEGSMRVTPMPMEELGPHLQGLCGYLEKNGGNAAARIRTLHTTSALGLVVEPGIKEATAFEILRRIVGASDGFMFLPDGNFYTRSGDTLLGEGLSPPTPQRVARRALGLMALSVRGLLDEDAGTSDEAEAEEMRQELWGWLAAQGLDEELEEEEAAVLQAPIGKAEAQQIVNAVWRAEGVQVLLWALGQRSLPAHDEQEHPYDVAKDLGMRSPDKPPILESPKLRGGDEIEAKRLQLQALSWRFTEFRLNAGGACDFRAFANNETVGAFSLAGLQLAGDDLAIRGVAIAEADPALVQLCSSIARERNVAANWLIGVNPVYGHVNAPT